MLFFAVVSLFVAGSSAGILEPGPCPKITGINFDMNRFAGKWHEYASTDNTYNNTLRCITHYWEPPVNGVSKMSSTGITANTGMLVQIESDASLRKPDNDIIITSHIPLIGDQVSEYWDLEDVYDNASICWSCKEVGANHIQTIDIWTRRNVPRGNVIARARQLAARKGLAVASYKFYFNICN